MRRHAKQDAAQYNPYPQTAPSPDNGHDLRLPVQADGFVNTPEERVKARKTIAALAVDAAEAEQLMTMLGLI